MDTASDEELGSGQPHPVLDISHWVPQDQEQLGSKPKRWYVDSHGNRWLFKEVRGQDRPQGPEGEDWAEKVASEIGRAMGIPCAQVELATHRGRRGIVSLAIIDYGDTLVHGDELLHEHDAGYDRSQVGAATGMTIQSVWAALAGVEPSPGTAKELLSFGARGNIASYLLFDALIGNTDRHHSNWAVIRTPGRPDRMAPSFDHASSLGFNVPSPKVQQKLAAPAPQHGVEGFVCRGRAKFEGRPLLTDLARDAASALGPEGRHAIIRLLELVDANVWIPVLRAIPDDVMSQGSRTFAEEVLRLNHQRLRDTFDD